MLRGVTPPKTAGLYVLFQLVGALIAGGFGRALRGSAAGYPKVNLAYGDVSGRAAAFWAEFLYSAALVFTVLSVATSKATARNHFFGLVS
jgi:glycerol uptake facilitator-like aquaporin